MKFNKKLVAGVMASLMMASSFAVPASAYANDNSYNFSFGVKKNQKWSYTDRTLYRGATTVATPWKVNFKVSSEGTNTIMQFFLLKASDTTDKVSDYKSVVVGTGAKYYRAYDEACEIDVKLGARNNNVVANTYDISGVWDEETAYHPFSDE